MICYRYDELGRVDDESCNCQDCEEAEVMSDLLPQQQRYLPEVLMWLKNHTDTTEKQIEDFILWWWKT